VLAGRSMPKGEQKVNKMLLSYTTSSLKWPEKAQKPAIVKERLSCLITKNQQNVR